jgi:uncharacterized protein (DUF58 family)
VRSVTLADRRRFIRHAEESSRPAARLKAEVTRVTGLTKSGMALVAAAVTSWITGYVVGGVPLYLFAYGALVVLAMSWTLARRPLALDGRRSDSRPRVAVGETLDLEVALHASRRVTTLILEEQLPPLLGQSARVAVDVVAPGTDVSHTYTVSAWLRGSHKLGPLTARVGDPFGLTQRELRLAEPFELLVHPAIEPVQDRPLTRLWEDPPVRPPVSKPWPSGMEFYGMRSYSPGDDIRKIVWRAFARTGQLLVKEAEQGITDKLVLVCDQDVAFHTKGVISESLEAGVGACASLAVHHLRAGYSVTVEGNSRRLAGPLRGGNAPMMVLDALARVELEKASLVDALTRLHAEQGRDAQLIVITPRLSPQAASRLELLVKRGMHVVVAALVWDDESLQTLATATSMGTQVVEIRPNVPLAVAFSHAVGAGGRS